ncbi:hypothetical protein N7509_013952 [Penicillium cosmopolitanum]|uniref:Homeobox domain-containing protein n=1 Tax=Penicillium cosmopolitanum TaxID=1131564 RepID=A0A9W9VF38_9EURO|nr:uncharacterized protein N7509_013952 [Penicillium cosmopolitanum]KAJ5377066.1 hypothetical protein N7509_013952 [Penicillium cosmopolitanum]
MDSGLPSDSCPPRYPLRQLSQSLSESELPSRLDPSMGDVWLHENPQADWNALDDFFFCSSDPTDLQWSQFMGLGSPQGFMEETQDYPIQQTTEHLVQPEPEKIPSQNLANVPQWLDGAYRPPMPCSHCRRHRLQCLILRTTEANPNPVTSCSSCVALFRECSLAKGEKRLPSRFETFSPVLGHLHGLPEDAEYGIANQQDVLGHDRTVTQGVDPGIENKDERKDSKQFVRKGARVLREWFYQNQEYPYPTEVQKEQLSMETGFSQKRVSTWFANARRRQKQKFQSSKQTSNSRSRAGSPMVTSTLSSMTPMERWKASPPEDEPVLESAIQDAIASGVADPGPASDPFHFDRSATDLFNLDETSSHLASSASSFESRASETSDSISSAWSHQSGEGNMPFPLLPKTPSSRRQRGRRFSEVECQYQCTFCTSSFRKRHDWARHEKSVHLQLDSWICTLNVDELYQQYSTSVDNCYFCDAPYPSPAHWDEHEFHICAGKPIAERSFSRKDYLWQHLRKFHACTKLPASDLDVWRGSNGDVGSRCGFCNQNLPDWASRAEHLAAHFKGGARMEQWQGNWGLDSSAMKMLRNAVLPSRRSLVSGST